MQDSLHLLRTRRFLPIFTTQFLGAFNDNLFRTSMVMLVIYGIYRDAAQEAAFSAIAGGLFILPFFLLSALVRPARRRARQGKDRPDREDAPRSASWSSARPDCCSTMSR